MATRIDQLYFELAVKGGPEANRLVGKFAGNLRRTGVGARAAERELRRYSRGTQRAERGTAGLGRAVRRTIGIFGGLFILRTIIGTMAGFETAMAEIATIAEGGTAAVAGFRQGILDLAQDVPQSPRELGTGLYQILSAGITDASDAMLVLEASSKAAVAGLTDTKTAVDAVTTILNAFRLSADQATRVTDVLFETVRLGKLRFEDIATSIGNAATSAALAGVRLEELTAAMATMTLAGIDSQEATTSLNRLFLTLVNQTAEQRRKFDELGIAFNTATVAEKGFAGLLEEVNKLTAGQLDMLAQLFPNIRAARSAFVLAGNSLDRYKEILEAVDSSTGSADAAFAIMGQTLENQFKLFRNQINVALQELAVDVIPFLIARINDLRIAFDALFDESGARARRATQEWSKALREATEPAAFRQIQEDAARAVVQLGQKLEEARGRIREELGLAAGAPIDLAAPALTQTEYLIDLVDTVRELEDQLKAAQEAARQAHLKLLFSESRTELDRFLETFNRQLRGLSQANLETEERAELERGIRQQGIRDANDLLDTLQLEGTERQRIVRFIEDQERALARLADAGEEGADAAADLMQDLQARIDEITLTAAQQQVAAIDELEAKFREVYGETLPDEARAGFEIVRRAAEEALRREQAEAIAEDFRAAVERGLRDIEFETLFIADEEERTAAILARQQTFLSGVVAQLHERLEATELTAEEEQVIRDLLLEIVKLLREAEEGQRAVADEARRDSDERLRTLRDTVQLIRQATEGAIDLAQAFGLVSEETAAILDSLGQIGAGVAQMAVGTPESLIAGGLGILGGLGGLFGESPEERARKEMLKRNTEALERLKLTIEGLRGTFDIAGKSFLDLQRATSTALTRFGEEPTRRPGSGPLTGLGTAVSAAADAIDAMRTFRRVLEAMGLTMEDAKEMARELGIELDFKGTPQQIRRQFEQLIEAIGQAETAFIGFPQTVEGLLDRLRFEFEVLDIESPMEQLQHMLTRLGEFAQDVEGGIPLFGEILGVDVTTAEGRRRADELLRQMAQEIAAGNQDLLSQLGVATQEEAIALLLEMERLLDQIQGDQAGQTQDVARSVQITELQASEWLALGRTQTILQERMEEHLRAMRAVMTGQAAPLITPPALPPLPLAGAVAAGSEQIVVNIGPIDVTIGAGATAESGRAAANALVDQISRELGRRLAERKRLLGLKR